MGLFVVADCDLRSGVDVSLCIELYQTRGPTVGAEGWRGSASWSGRGMGAWFSPPSINSGAPQLGMLWRATRGGESGELVGKTMKDYFWREDFGWAKRLAWRWPGAQQRTYEWSSLPLDNSGCPLSRFLGSALAVEDLQLAGQVRLDQ